MKRVFLLLLLMNFACFAQEIGNVKVHTKDGITVSSYDFNSFRHLLEKKNDTVYVVNFWATWCAPCVKELPFFEKINSAYKNKKVKVLLVSLDMNKQVETGLLPFIKKRNLQSEVVHLHDPDADSWIAKVDPSWTGALPATVIYSKDERKFFEQSFTYEGLENEVKQFIN
ncbi:MAG TPA: TlpA disulfide reductase family protein [Flavobacterium sp.]|nr:TlpA disulfide reductase family protein [Flavobacterium sp.]